MSPADFCILFDMDGTLVDSERLMAQSFADLLPTLDDDLDEVRLRYRGGKLPEIVEDLELRYGGVPKDFIKLYRARLAELMEAELKTFPGVAKALRELPYPLAIATNAPREKVEIALRVTGLDEIFEDRIFSAYDIDRWKPDPDLFLHAASELDFPPNRTIVVEDSNPGFLAANAAGMNLIKFEPEGPSEGSATSIDSFEQLNEAVDAIADLAGAQRARRERAADTFTSAFDTPSI